jgi:hypothetical protein
VRTVAQARIPAPPRKPMPKTAPAAPAPSAGEAQLLLPFREP